MNESRHSTWLEIMRMPTTYKNIHESCLRSYNILQEVKWLLEQNAYPSVIFSVIKLLEYQLGNKTIEEFLAEEK